MINNPETNPMNPLNSPMSTSILHHRYKLASLKVLNKYPQWKRTAVLDDLKNSIDNSYTNQYAQDVIVIAENDQISLTE